MFVLYITNLIIIKWVIHLLTLLLDNLADQYQEHIIMQITDKCLRQKNLKWSNNHRNIFLYLLHLYFIKVSKCLVISMWSSTWNDVLRVAGRFLIFPFFCSFPACEPGGDLGPTTERGVTNTSPRDTPSTLPLSDHLTVQWILYVYYYM